MDYQRSARKNWTTDGRSLEMDDQRSARKNWTTPKNGRPRSTPKNGRPRSTPKKRWPNVGPQKWTTESRPLIMDDERSARKNLTTEGRPLKWTTEFRFRLLISISGFDFRFRVFPKSWRPEVWSVNLENVFTGHCWSSSFSRRRSVFGADRFLGEPTFPCF